MKFNTKDGKFKVMNVGKNNPHNVYLLGDEPLINVKSEVDLGVSINSNWDQEDLLYYHHILTSSIQGSATNY